MKILLIVCDCEAPWHNGQRAGTRSEVRILAMPLFCAATPGKLFTNIASPVFSAPRNWRAKGSIWTGPI